MADNLTTLSLLLHVWFYACLTLEFMYFYCYVYVFSLYVYVWLP
jgi:hypothetical protein